MICGVLQLRSHDVVQKYVVNFGLAFVGTAEGFQEKTGVSRGGGVDGRENEEKRSMREEGVNAEAFGD